MIGMKSLGGGQGEDREGRASPRRRSASGSRCRRTIAAVVSGMDSMDVLKKNIATARNFKPLEGEELRTLLAKVKPHAGRRPARAVQVHHRLRRPVPPQAARVRRTAEVTAMKLRLSPRSAFGHNLPSAPAGRESLWAL